MKLIIPHIHKTLGGAGFFSRVSQRGEIKELRVTVLEGLRQIEGILIGRRIFETPLVISRICGICPTSHILNACAALEKALNITPSLQTDRLRRLITSAQIIQSHSAHLFFMSLSDFFNIDDDEKLVEKFSKESKAVLKLRDFGLKIIEAVGGRTVHPITPMPGGFSKVPDKQDLKKSLANYQEAHQASLLLINLFKNLEYPELKRKTVFCSSYSEKDYPYHKGEKIKIGDNIFSPDDFFSNQVEEDLKTPPTKRVTFQGKSYMLGAIARIKNNWSGLNQGAKLIVQEFQKNKQLKQEEFFENNFYNSFCQAVEILHCLEQIKEDIELLLKEKTDQPYVKYQVKPGKGLGLLEAPRGALLSYFEIGKNGRIADCSIITPTAQFLRNLEEDLKVLLPTIKDLPKDKKIRRVKTLIRAYDPCISCAVH